MGREHTQRGRRGRCRKGGGYARVRGVWSASMGCLIVPGSWTISQACEKVVSGSQ